MLRTATPVHGPHPRFTTAARLLLVCAVVVAVLGVAPEAGAAVLASVKNGTLTVKGGNAAEKITLRAGAPGRLVVDVGDNGSADFTFRRSAFTRIVVNAGGGGDRLRINESNGVFTNTEATTLNGQAGNDVVLGGSRAEVLRGGTENDTIDGNRGNDDVGMGAGSDSFVWNAGDGADRDPWRRGLGHGDGERVGGRRRHDHRLPHRGARSRHRERGPRCLDDGGSHRERSRWRRHDLGRRRGRAVRADPRRRRRKRHPERWERQRHPRRRDGRRHGRRERRRRRGAPGHGRRRVRLGSR